MWGHTHVVISHKELPEANHDLLPEQASKNILMLSLPGFLFFQESK